MCWFHKWVSVVDADHTVCGRCFAPPGRLSPEIAARYPRGYCPHSFKVCSKCGEAVGYGSHGKLSLIPDTCKAQIKLMQIKKEVIP
jgi:hypothetical protein